ncbi:aldose 1-epimerase [Nocardia tenerifensis]|uniref:Aldose 1-epimerase n=1 Tax=Nocardia tenerifensis TaxID=228006 RepID=A0A318KCV2_9NOCA|nr:aldose 1-epimerase family protein [Nocardia tenerifensis]PXX69386.1 aldose 1-epimerase [Nocardia tenerifensis]
MTPPPSGQQFSIGLGDQRAVIVEVGGGIREFRVAGRDVLEPYDVAAMADGGRGTALIPWPNRLADGAYRFDGVDHQLPLTEPAKRTAIHGLLRWRPWRATDAHENEITMRTTLHPRKGYPFHLDVAICYALSDDGLTVTTTATNLGDTAAPYGCGQHPYLSPGCGRIDDAVLHFDAATRIVTDPDRGLPVGTEPVRGTPYDFTTPKPVGALVFDDPFTDLARDADGLARVRLRGDDGAVAELWMDDSYPVVQLFSADTLAPSRRRTGLAVEPMTCPPNAFRTGDGLIRLAPGATVRTTWGARLVRT